MLDISSIPKCWERMSYHMKFLRKWSKNIKIMDKNQNYNRLTFIFLEADL